MSFAADSRAPGTHRSGEDVPQEGVGPVASDSLAAESIKEGGDFARGEAVPSSQPGAGSTFNTTDTSGATTLHAAASAESREQQDERGLGSDEKGPGGVKYPEGIEQAEFTGRHNLDGYTGGPSADRPSGGYITQAAGASDFGATTTSSSSSSGQAERSDEIKSSSNTDAVPGAVSGASVSPSSDSQGPSTGTGVRPHVPEAPTYAGTVAGTIQSEGQNKVKGENLTEGDIPETKTFTGNVGGQYDPGRLAERDFEKNTAAPAGNAASAAGNTDASGATDDNPYNVLSSERA